MRFSLSTVSASLADHLRPFFPDVTFYQDPVQQALKCPCAFLQQRSSKIWRRIGRRQYRPDLFGGLQLTQYAAALPAGGGNLR